MVWRLLVAPDATAGRAATRTPLALLVAAVVATVALLGGTWSAVAQVVYRDAEGVTHFVDSPEQVPPQFRPRATEKIPPPPSRPAAPERPRLVVSTPRGADAPWVLWLFIAPRDPRLFTVSKWSMLGPYDSKSLCLQAQDTSQLEARRVIAEGEQIIIFTCRPAGVDPQPRWESGASKAILALPLPLIFALAFALGLAWMLARPE